MRKDVAHFLATYEGDRARFLAQLRKELSLTFRLMELEPWYAGDWQAIIDRDGKLYDIDVGHGEAPDKITPDEMTAVINTIDAFGFSKIDWIDMCCTWLQLFIRFVTERIALYAEGSNAAAAGNTAMAPAVAGGGKSSYCSSLHSFRRGRDFGLPTVVPACERVADSCVVASSANPRVGYQVTNVESKTLAANWDIAKLLTIKHKVKHTVLGRPHLVNTTRAAFNATMVFTNTPVNPGKEILLVQKVLRIPGTGPLFMFSCSPSILNRLESFVRSSVRDRRRFLRRVRARALSLIRMGRERSFPSGFRALIDTSGDIFLIDLHRYVANSNNSTKKSTEACLSILVNIKQRV